MKHLITISLILLTLLTLLALPVPVHASPLIWGDEWQLTYDPVAEESTWDPGLHKNITTIYPVPDFDGLPTIAQAQNGGIWLVWQSDVTGNEQIFYKINTGPWTNDTQLTNNAYNDIAPSIIQASDGKIWVAWSSNRTGLYDIYYKTTSNYGLTWSLETQAVSNPNDDNSPALLQANDGKIWLAWARSINSTNQELFYQTFNGASWSGETQLTNNPNLDQMPALMQTSDGKIWVFWNRLAPVPDPTNPHFEILYKTFDGSTWSSETQLTNDTKIDNVDPTVFQAKDGTIWLFWAAKPQGTNAAFDLWFKTSVNNGATWSASTQFTTDPADDMWPTAMQPTDKSIWVVWTSMRPDPVYNVDNVDLYYKTTLLGDITGPSGVPDGSIDIYDLAAIARAAGTDPIHFPTGTGWNEWNPNADLNVDNVVNVLDLFIAGKNYGRTA